jgi:hypothetical protein
MPGTIKMQKAQSSVGCVIRSPLKTIPVTGGL